MNFVLEVNERLKRYDNVVIFGVSNGSKQIFFSLLYGDITVSAFYSEQYCDKGILLYNKDILSCKEVIRKKNCAIILPNQRYEEFKKSKLRNFDIYVDLLDCEKTDKKRTNIYPLYIINRNLIQQPIIFYGCGQYGKILFQHIIDAGGQIDICIDSDLNKQGKYFMGKKICSRNILKEHEKRPIVIGTVHWEEVYNSFSDCLREQSYIEHIEAEIRNSHFVYQKMNQIIRINELGIVNLIEKCKSKRLVVLGMSDEALLIGHMLEKVGFLIDEKIEYVQDLLYEDRNNLMIVNCANSPFEIETTLNSYGFINGFDYISSPDFEGMTWQRYSGYDYLLGNTYKLEGQYLGFTRYLTGNSDERIRIVTLGGSTTDAQLYPFKCWSEILKELLEQDHIAAEILCGGMADYNSCSEMIKLLRDVIKIKPDIVLSYSGINDMNIERFGRYSQFPFLNGLMLEYIEKSNAVSGKNMQYGIPEKRDIVDVWIENESTMNIIAKEHGISFFAFFQPCLTNRFFSEDDNSYIEKMLNYHFTDFEQKEVCWSLVSNCKQFMEKIPKLQKKWLFDLSHIFDDKICKDIYLDPLHVTEKGNYIIARNIYQKIKLEIKRKLDKEIEK